MIAEEEGGPNHLFSTDSPLHSMTGDLERLALFAGQSAGAVARIESAAAVVEDMVAAAIKAISALPRPVARSR